ncbi:MAG TPA: hypothetical protein VK738_12090 [Terriglobales bacterium]|jgi:hypothetical protein|nr:hypothetical protein [Terriglobales bacterium]
MSFVFNDLALKSAIQQVGGWKTGMEVKVMTEKLYDVIKPEHGVPIQGPYKEQLRTCIRVITPMGAACHWIEMS